MNKLLALLVIFLSACQPDMPTHTTPAEFALRFQGRLAGTPFVVDARGINVACAYDDVTTNEFQVLADDQTGRLFNLYGHVNGAATISVMHPSIDESPCAVTTSLPQDGILYGHVECGGTSIHPEAVSGDFVVVGCR